MELALLLCSFLCEDGKINITAKTRDSNKKNVKTLFTSVFLRMSARCRCCRRCCCLSSRRSSRCNEDADDDDDAEDEILSEESTSMSTAEALRRSKDDIDDDLNPELLLSDLSNVNF